MTRMTASISILVLALALAQATPIGAQGADAREGYLTATACGKLPQPLRLDVRAMDNTVENLRLREILVDRLGRRGIAVEAGASVVLSFDVARISRPTRRKERDLGELTGSINERARVRLNIWSSRRDSLLGGRREGVISEAVDRLRIVVAVDAKGDGRCLWRAEAVHDVAGRDPRHIAAGMIAPLAESIGRAVSRKPIYVE